MVHNAQRLLSCPLSDLPKAIERIQAAELHGSKVIDRQEQGYRSSLRRVTKNANININEFRKYPYQTCNFYILCLNEVMMRNGVSRSCITNPACSNMSIRLGESGSHFELFMNVD